jgi:hypothetical protein
VYRFTVGTKIFVFGMLAQAHTLEEFKELVYSWGYIKLYDGSYVDLADVTDIRVYDVECPVGFIMQMNGQMLKAY